MCPKAMSKFQIYNPNGLEGDSFNYKHTQTDRLDMIPNFSAKKQRGPCVAHLSDIATADM